MEEKKCNRCNSLKDISEFNKSSWSKDGYRGYCRLCQTNMSKKYRESNNDKLKLSHKKYYQDNKEILLKKSKEWYVKNINKQNERSKKYYENNKVSVIERTKNYNKVMLSENLLFKLKQNVRNRIKAYLKTNNIRKKNSTFDIVGCTPIELKEHLEIQFKDGMDWSNQGKWHIDHIIPLSSSKNEKEIIRLCHYTNLQPLWAIDNMKKGSKTPF